ncbi:MAG: amidohydrolase [Ruminococcus sp.]|jgi:5-methylthioadenosine/S-adenosylhomocysteine deaminase|nr:amidohydrolase [Ruminococcus sp.]
MIRFYNANILSVTDMDINYGEVWVDGDKIVYVGENKESDTKFDTEINLAGDLLMPSFKNAHAHSAMTFLRSYADGMPLQDWLFTKIFPMEEKLNEDIVYQYTKLAAAEYFKNGITTAFDMYFYPEGIARASVETGLRSIICSGISGGAENAERTVERLENDFNTYKDYDPLVSYRLGFHSEYLCDNAVMQRVAWLAKKYSAPVYMHNSETAREVIECKERHGGMTPTQVFYDLGVLQNGGGGFHCVHMTDNDLEIMRLTGSYIVTNPCSNAKLSSGIARLTAANSAGVKLAIGTDGASSNNALDMFREMYLMCVLQKLSTGDAAAMPAAVALKAATYGGADCMKLPDLLDIKEGQTADMIVIDMNKPSMQPIIDVIPNLVFSGSPDVVKLTMANGKIVYRDGEYTTIDLAKLLYDSNEMANKLYERS